jgi:hypothetical protein
VTNVDLLLNLISLLGAHSRKRRESPQGFSPHAKEKAGAGPGHGKRQEDLDAARQ